MINRHPIWAGVAVAVLVGCLIYVTTHNYRPGTPDGDFIDELTGQTYVMPISSIPPLPGKDGNLTVVRAYYLNPTDGGPRKLLYLQKYCPRPKHISNNIWPSIGRVSQCFPIRRQRYWSADRSPALPGCRWRRRKEDLSRQFSGGKPIMAIRTSLIPLNE